MLTKIKISDYMTKNIMTVKQDMDVVVAIKQLLDHHLTCAPVLNDKGKLVGIFSERDCMKVVLNSAYNRTLIGKVEDYMCCEIITVQADSSIVDLADRFQETSVRSYPVLEGNDLVGIVSHTDVLRALVACQM